MADLVHAPATTAPAPEGPYVAGFWRTPDGFRAAARAARDAGHTNIQAYMPYPVHGFEELLGLERSWIGRPVFALCCLGFLAAFGMCWDRMDVNFPLIYGGKPYGTWQLFVVVTLETGLLLGALANLLLCFHTCRLLPNPAFMPMDPRLSDDTFAIAIPITSRHSADQLERWFHAQQAEEVRVQPTAAAEVSHV